MTGLIWTALYAILAAGAILSALFVILHRNPVASVFSFVIHSAFLAGLYLLYGSQFLAAIQTIVYAGAILVLFLFVVMLLDARHDPLGMAGPEWKRIATLAILLAASGLLAVAAVRDMPAPPVARPAEDTVRSIAGALYRDYLLPFEAITALLFAAMLAVVIFTGKGFVPKPPAGEADR